MKRSLYFLSLIAILLSLFAVPLSAGAASSKNPLGVLIVKFNNGLTQKQMRDAVTNAGGEIVTDLTKIKAIAAVPSTSNFKNNIAANPNVKKVFEDKLSIRISPVDAGNEPSGKNNPELGNPGPNGPPDPWH